MLKYFDDFVGKNLGFGVFAELMFYFSLNMVPLALPLAVLVSSLMTFGQLGEHFELTAIKSAGISLIRILVPIFSFVILLSIGAFLFNNHVVPAANLKAYSLLFDIKQTKASLDIRAGQFYDGLPGYSIRARKKYPDGVAMRDVLIYDHTNGSENKKVISADSCRMYTFLDDRYLMMELYSGNHYIEDDEPNNKKKKDKDDPEIARFVRTKFDRMDLVFSLSSFDLDRSNVDLFANNRYMKSIDELTESIDSMSTEQNSLQFRFVKTLAANYKFNLGGYVSITDDFIENYDRLSKYRNDSMAVEPEELNGAILNEEDGMRRARLMAQGQDRHSLDEVIQFKADGESQKQKNDAMLLAESSIEEVDKQMAEFYKDYYMLEEAARHATSDARNVKTSINTTESRILNVKKSIDAHVVEKYKKYAQAVSCIVMFLIGAPLGAIIKKGGMGFPVVISVFFFVVFYVITSVTDKWAKAGRLDGMVAAWMANMVLLPPGLYFLKQARKDSRIFDSDVWNGLFYKYMKFRQEGGALGWMVKKGWF